MCGGEAQDLPQFLVPADHLRNRPREVRRRTGFHRGRLGIRFALSCGRGGPDLVRELVPASGDRADQLAFRPKGAAQRRNLSLQIVVLNHPAGPHARHQRVFADDGAARLDQHRQHVKSTAAEPDRLVVGEELAAMRQQPETTERDARRRSGGGTECLGTIGRMSEDPRSFQDRSAMHADRVPHLNFSDLFIPRPKI
jgi:hypothetical protein